MALDLIQCRLSLRESNATFAEQKATLNQRKSQIECHWADTAPLARTFPMKSKARTVSHDIYENPLITRYASREMATIWSAQKKHSTWRRLWIALGRVLDSKTLFFFKWF